jgi:hypothetical protein
MSAPTSTIMHPLVLERPVALDLAVANHFT